MCTFAAFAEPAEQRCGSAAGEVPIGLRAAKLATRTRDRASGCNRPGWRTGTRWRRRLWRLRPRIRENGEWPRGHAFRPAKPLEPVLDALPMGDERDGILVLGILRDVAGLIARLDWAYAEEAWLADFRVVGAERPGGFESQSPQVGPRRHLAA